MRDWLRLLRVVGLATVASNALATVTVAVYSSALAPDIVGELLVRGGARPWWILLASACLYCSGMLWNDLADLDRDRLLHPQRPLPSGRIAFPTALTAGLLLPSTGLLAAAVAGERAFLAAGLVLSLILAYNLGAKRVPWLGSICMGAVRAVHACFLLLLLGDEYFDRVVIVLISVASLKPVPGTGLLPMYPMLLGIYVTGLTLVSELETRRGRRIELILGAGLMISCALVAVGVALSAHWLGDLRASGKTVLAVLALLPILAIGSHLLWSIGRPLLHGIRSGQRRWAGPSVAAGLFGMMLIDCLVATAHHPVAGLLILGLLPVFRTAAALIGRME